MAGFEQVYYYDYYDGPRKGVADFNGIPHYFESQFKDIGSDQEDIFYLSPVIPEILELAKESWAIWKRWEEANIKGQVAYDTHPYLPQDRARGLEIDGILDNQLKIDKSNFIQVHGDFKVQEYQEGALGMRLFRVEWK